MLASNRDNTEGVIAAYTNRRNEILDKLNHYAKNLLKIIDDLN